MEKSTIKILYDLNQQFYQTFAHSFSNTRSRIQPGVRFLLRDLKLYPSILDLGCGNGELVLELVRQGFQGKYVGLDFSEPLLEIAQSRFEKSGFTPQFRPRYIRTNLLEEEWKPLIAEYEAECIVAFAVLHHIPSHAARLELLKRVREILSLNQGLDSSNRFYFSVWQFLNKEKQLKRIHPWSEIGLAEDQVEPNDYLLDWKEGGFGFRYVHYFTEEELSRLAREAGFSILKLFYSDGREGNLALYQIWEVKSE